VPNATDLLANRTGAPVASALRQCNGMSGGKNAWECRAIRKSTFAAFLPAMAHNLWTQELHANRIQALIARPETDNAGRFTPIGVAISVAIENL